MPLSPGFPDYVLELLKDFGPVEAKRMFGGAGIFKDGIMFAILDDDVIYVRADDALAADLEKQGASKWIYSKKPEGRAPNMKYWSLPETAADDPDAAVAIARRAFQAAVALKADKKPRSLRRTTGGGAPSPRKSR